MLSIEIISQVNTFFDHITGFQSRSRKQRLISKRIRTSHAVGSSENVNRITNVVW